MRELARLGQAPPKPRTQADPCGGRNTRFGQDCPWRHHVRGEDAKWVCGWRFWELTLGEWFAGSPSQGDQVRTVEQVAGVRRSWVDRSLQGPLFWYGLRSGVRDLIRRAGVRRRTSTWPSSCTSSRTRPSTPSSTRAHDKSSVCPRLCVVYPL